MGLTARRSHRLRARSRAAVSLVVIAAWFGTLLVAAPTSSPAAAGTPAPAPPPPPTVTSPGATGHDATPTWTITVPADSSTPQPPVFDTTTSETSTATIAVTHAPECGLSQSGLPTFVACTSSGGGVFTFTPPALSSPEPGQTYTFYAHDVVTTTETTVVENDSGPVDPQPAPVVTGPDPSSDVTDAYLFDDVAPAVTLQSGPSGLVAAGNGWTFTSSEAGSVTCALSGGPTAASGPCDPTHDFPGNALADGNYVVTATTTDAAGNTGTATDTYAQDTNGPVLTLGKGPAAGTGNDTTPGWQVSSDDAAPVTCTLRLDNVAVANSAGPCKGVDYPATPLSGDGTYELTATSTDAALNTRTTVLATYLLDTKLPVVTVVDPDATNPAAPTWTITTDEASAVPQCTLTGIPATGTFATRGPAPCDATATPNTYTYTASPPLAEGTYTLKIDATDTAGNAAVQQSNTYVYDKTGPAPPVVGSGDNGNPGYAIGPISWSVAPGGVVSDTKSITCVVSYGGATITTDNTCGPTITATPTNAQQGVWTLKATAYDAAGNASALATDSTTYDSVIASPVVARNGGTLKAPIWHVTVASDVTATCSVAGGILAATDCTNKDVTVNLAGQPGKVYTLVVSSTDAAGNVAPDATSTYALPADAPVVSVAAMGNNTKPAWTITAQSSGVTLTCTLFDGTATSAPGVPCADGMTPTLSHDGVWNLRVVASYLDGTTTVSSPVGTTTAGYRLDTINPGDPTIASTPSGATKATSITWPVTAAADGGDTDHVVCVVSFTNLSGVTSTPQTLNDCATTDVHLTFGSAADQGVWQVTATAYDAVGNTSATVSGPQVTFDNTPPNKPTIHPLTSPSNNPSPTWTIDTDAFSSLECAWSTPSTVPASTDWFSCNPVGVITVPNPADGTYTLHARATDTAGNLGPEATTVDYELDRTKPALATVSTPTSPSSSAAVTWNIDTTPEITPTVKCQLLRDDGTGTFGVVTGFGWAACTTTTTMKVTLPSEGTYRLQVEVTDRAGNIGPVRTSADYTYDKTPPVAPAVTGPTGPSQVRDVTWTITPTDINDTLECRFVENGSAIGSFTTCQTKTQVTRTGLPDGSYALQVQERDAAGNVSTPVVVSPTYVIDNVGPVAPTFGGLAGTGKTKSTSWSFSVANEPNSTSSCLLLLGGVAKVGDSPALCQSGDTFALTRGDGAYQVEVFFTDAAGNAGASARSPIYTLDTVPPAAPTNIVGSVTGTANTTSARYTFTTDPGTVSCRLLFAPAGTLTAPAPITPGTYTTCTSPWAVTFAAGDGNYQLQLHVTDAAGNVGPDAESAVYTLDTTGPAKPVFVTQPTGTARFKTVTWTWTGESPSTGLCTLSFTPLGSTTAQSGAPVACDAFTYTTTLGADGAYQLSVQLVDPSTNKGIVGVSQVYNLDATPPGAPTVSGPGGTSNKTSADYAITSVVEPLATSECRLTRDTTVVSDWAACTMPRTIALGVDGSYLLEVRLTDQYGNQGPAGASPAYLLDTKLPTVPVVTAPSSPSANGAPVFGIVTDADTTTTCRLSRGSIVAVDTTSCTGSFTAPLGGQPDGDYVLEVTATDPAGNVATGASKTYTYDTTKPAAPGVTGPAGPSQTRNPAFSWSGEVGARPECSLQEKAGAPSGWVACASPYAPTLATDGTWVLSVRLIDAAGNVSDPGQSGGYVLDTTAPAAPVVTAPPSPGRDLAPSWSAAIEDGSHADCRLSGPGQLGSWAPCTLPMTTTISGDGTYTFEVRTTDAAGNVSAAGAATYELDTTAPVAPAVAQPSSPGRNRTPSVTFTSETGTVGSCKLSRGATVLSDPAPCSSPTTLNLTGLPDGAYTLSVRAIDAAGNIGPAGTATYVLDTTAPAAPTMTLVAGSPSSDRAPQFGFNVELGTTPSCKVTLPSAVVRDLTCSNAVTLDLSGATDGDYVLNVRATDPAGNVSAPATTTYHLDSNAPAAPKVVGPATPGSIRNPVWKISSSSPAECRLSRGTTVMKDWAPCTTSYAADLFAQPDAVYILEARVVGTTAATMSRYRLDTSGPTAATIVGPPSPSTDRKPTWAVSSADTTVHAECRVMVFTGVLKDWSPCAVSTAGSLYTLDLTGLGDGTYSLLVRLTDAAGNVGPTATSDYVLDTSAPAAVGVIAPLSPGNDTTPTWTLTSAAGVNLECRLSSGQKVISDFAPCTGAFTADLSGLPDGTYTLTVHALSAAGTPGPDTTSGYILDTTAAGGLGALSGPTGPSRDRAPKWTFTLPSGTTGVCKVTLAGKVFRDGPCISPFVLDLSNAADGTYTLTVRATDQAGNPSAPSTANYILKTTPPPAPVLTMTPGSPSSTTDPRWGFSLPRGTSAQCRLLQDGTPLEDWTACGTAGATNGTYTALLSGKPDGRYTVQVRAIDEAQNTSSAVAGDYVFDRSAQPLAIFVDTPPTPSNDTSPTWVVAAPPADATPVTAAGTAALVRAAALTGTPQTECRLTTPHGVGAWAPCSGKYVATTNGDGSYLLEVRAFDSTGARGPASSSSYLLDTKAPAAPRLVDPMPPAVGNDAEVVWSWADDGNLVQCHLLRNGSPLGAFTACDLVYVANVGRLGEATYTIEGRAVDAAGNVSSPPTTDSYRYDITPPAAPAFTSRPAARGSASSVGWTFAVPVDTHALCVVTRNGTVISEGACGSAFNLDLHGQQPATWVLSVHLVDGAGNAGPSSSSSYTLVSAIGRGRVSGPTGNVPPGAPGPGPGSAPGSGPAVVGPGGSNPSLDPQQPRAGALRIPQVVKKTIKQVARVTGAIPGAVPGTDVPKAIKNVLGQTITKPQLPLALFVIVLLFLLVQNRIDRRDPKLAVAPANAEPELTFGPILRPGGATA
ncbi:MAG: large repetitive protein [Actinomycetota bacterium]|jgi:hypothetical protein|nr:large repetitive protein [Actinomycetota bacterium]